MSGTCIKSVRRICFRCEYLKSAGTVIVSYIGTIGAYGHKFAEPHTTQLHVLSAARVDCLSMRCSIFFL